MTKKISTYLMNGPQHERMQPSKNSSPRTCKMETVQNQTRITPKLSDLYTRNILVVEVHIIFSKTKQTCLCLLLGL